MKSAKSILIALTLTLAPLYLISPPAALSDCGGDSEDCCKAKDEKGKDNKKAEEKVKDDTKSNTALLGKSGVNPDFMDQKALPGKDFYLYANGTWLKNTPIPDEYDKWGVLNIINDQNLKKLKNILEAAKANDKAEADFKPREYASSTRRDMIGSIEKVGAVSEPARDHLASLSQRFSSVG